MSDEKINLFGLELLQKTVENAIKSKEDKCIVLLHWMLLKRHFRCIGSGDEKTLSVGDVTSELLPNGWNEGESYMLRYSLDSKIYLARVSKVESGLLVNFIKAEDMKITSVMITESDVDLVNKSDYYEVVRKIEKEVLDGLLPKENVSMESLLVNYPPPPIDPFSSVYDERRRYPNIGIGRSDLDPFAFGSEGNPGMLFPEPGRRGPFGGIRFDPINPGQGPLRPRGGRPWGSDPDPDHFAPPGSGYFM